MSTYGQRLREAMTAAEYSAINLATFLDCSRGAIYQVLDGSTQGLSVENHMKACRALNVDPFWLALGEGVMRKPGQATVNQIPLISPEHITADTAELFANVTDSSMIDAASLDPRGFCVRCPNGKMVPRFMNGEMLLVSPSSEPTIEDDVLVIPHNGAWFIARLISRRGGVVVSWFATPGAQTIPEDDIVTIWPVANTIRPV